MTTPSSVNSNDTVQPEDVNQYKKLLEGSSGYTTTFTQVSTPGANHVIRLGDTAGANKLSIQDSASVEQASINSDGALVVNTFSASTGSLILPQSASPAQTAEGSVVWDTDDDVLTMGTGAATKRLGLTRGAGSSATATAEMVYDTTAAQLKVWDGSASQTIGPVMALVASSSTPTTTTSTSAVDLVTLSGLSIANTSFIRIVYQFRKTATAAQAVAFGLKTNLGVHAQAQVSAGLPQSSANTAAEMGIAVIEIPPRITNYTNTPLSGFYSCASNAGGTSASGAVTFGTQNWTTGTVTSIILQAINGTSNNNAEIAWVKVYTY